MVVAIKAALLGLGFWATAAGASPLAGQFFPTGSEFSCIDWDVARDYQFTADSTRCVGDDSGRCYEKCIEVYVSTLDLKSEPSRSHLCADDRAKQSYP
jgi:hypothetical protein